MILFYSTVAALVLLVGLAVVVVRQNRDLVRARAYREFFVRMIPVLSTAVFVAGLPFVMGQATVENYGPTLFVYLGGAAVLTILTTRAVAPEERRAGAYFRAEDYEAASEVYENLVQSRPLPRYYSALAACLDASGNPQSALEASEQAIKQDSKLGIAYYNRASALVALGEASRARSDLQMVYQVDSSRRLREAAGQALDALESR